MIEIKITILYFVFLISTLTLSPVIYCVFHVFRLTEVVEKDFSSPIVAFYLRRSYFIFIIVLP